MTRGLVWQVESQPLTPFKVFPPFDLPNKNPAFEKGVRPMWAPRRFSGKSMLHICSTRSASPDTSNSPSPSPFQLPQPNTNCGKLLCCNLIRYNYNNKVNNFLNTINCRSNLARNPGEPTHESNIWDDLSTPDAL